MTGSRKYNFKCQSFPNTIEQERRRRQSINRALSLFQQERSGTAQY